MTRDTTAKTVRLKKWQLRGRNRKYRRLP